MIKFNAVPTKILYYAEESQFIIVKATLISDGLFSHITDREVSISGNVGNLLVHSEYLFQGEEVQHPKFGWQLKVNSANIVRSSKLSIIHYLSSDSFPGIGIKLAQAIVDKLGENCIELIIGDTSQLQNLSIHGLTQKKKQVILSKILSNAQFESFNSLLLNEGFNSKLGQQIFEIYKENTLFVVENKPYILLENEGMKFSDVDRIAQIFTKVPVENERKKALIQHAIFTYVSQQGDTYVGFENITDVVYRIDQSYTKEEIITMISLLVEEELLIIIENLIYLPAYYYTEKAIELKLKSILERSNTIITNLDFEIELLEKKYSIKFDEIQKKALITSVNQPITIITGGPGTGKSTIIQALISIVSKHYESVDIALLAPTGRAAKRLSFVEIVESKTIHSFLGWDLHKNEFAFNENNPILIKVLIIDEFSMVDMWLFHHLLKSLPHLEKIILVGDKNQLTSIGTGQLLSDFINFNEIPTCELLLNFRQRLGSNIINLAQKVNSGDVSENDLINTTDTSFIPSNTAIFKSHLFSILKNLSSKHYTVEQFQILIPIYKSVVGIDVVNEFVQAYYFEKSKDFVIYRQTKYYVGDKVLVLKNISEKKVNNGDLGLIVEIIHEQNNEYKFIVEIDKVEIVFEYAELDAITLGYATSIHKAQGSEFEIVIFPVFSNYHFMLARHLLYTAITRARKALVIIGDSQTFINGARRVENSRNTSIFRKLATQADFPVQTVQKNPKSFTEVESAWEEDGFTGKFKSIEDFL